MQWERLTSPEFAQAVKETGVCIIATGVLERHSDHLPLGTDMLNGHQLACNAAEKEPAVVFPPFYFGQIYEARCFPGTITVEPKLLMELIEAVLDEIGRNGFKKIIILNAHGGNNHLVRFIAQCSLWKEKPYTLYVYTGEMKAERRQEWENLMETPFDWHAGETETSITMANFPELVKMERVPPVGEGNPLARMKDLSDNFSGISWYANFPEHYAGNAKPASIEKGQAFVKLEVDSLAEFIARVKKDTVTPALNKEFFERVRIVEEGG